MTFQRLQFVTFTISCLLTWIILFFIISAYLIFNKFSLTLVWPQVNILSTCTYSVCMYVCTRFDAVPYSYFLVCWWIQRNRCSVFARIRKHICYKNHYSYLFTYDLYSPLHNVLDVCKWKGVGPWKLRVFWAREMASPFGPKKLEISRAQPPPK